MNFTFEYQILDEIKHITVMLDDAVVAEAQKLGVDLPTLETEAKAAIDGLVGRITDPGLWQRVTQAVEHAVEVIEEELKVLVEGSGSEGSANP